MNGLQVQPAQGAAVSMSQQPSATREATPTRDSGNGYRQPGAVPGTWPDGITRVGTFGSSKTQRARRCTRRRRRFNVCDRVQTTNSKWHFPEEESFRAMGLLRPPCELVIELLLYHQFMQRVGKISLVKTPISRRSRSGYGSALLGNFNISQADKKRVLLSKTRKRNALVR
jgi:hypothetical protein